MLIVQKNGCVRPGMVAIILAGFSLFSACDLIPGQENEDPDEAFEPDVSAFVAVVEAFTSADTLEGTTAIRPFRYVLAWTDGAGKSRTDTLPSTELAFSRMPDDNPNGVLRIVLPDEVPAVGIYGDALIDERVEQGKPPFQLKVTYAPSTTCRYVRASGDAEISVSTPRRVAGRFAFRVTAVSVVRDGRVESTCPGVPQSLQIKGRFNAVYGA